ncbi:MAG: phosphate signaling complex protein PhoU [Dysgonamonadaceae bacterium]|jgi:phosphate transport system protein|nr:phosphate signaling complex protein PhoU [Dysgonamonadaceae bacterium]
MKHAEKELLILKEEVSQMWQLVLSQLDKAKIAFLNNDFEMAREVVSREKRVNSYELKIDSDCENYIALYNPVAIDLRLALSLFKICSTLERIADFAEGIARHIIEENCEPFTAEMKANLRIETMFDTAIEMLSDSYTALDSENTRLAGKILSKDEIVDEIYIHSMTVLAEAIRNQIITPECGLKTLLVMRKIERIGDHCSNIVEEIVFYIDAKVLKHNKNSLPLSI